MTREEMLLGWLVICRYQEEDECEESIRFALPDAVTEGWIEHGWAKRRKAGWDGIQVVRITRAGRAAADLAAPEWMVNPIQACGQEEGSNG